MLFSIEHMRINMDENQSTIICFSLDDFNAIVSRGSNVYCFEIILKIFFLQKKNYLILNTFFRLGDINMRSNLRVYLFTVLNFFQPANS